MNESKNKCLGIKKLNVKLKTIILCQPLSREARRSRKNLMKFMRRTCRVFRTDLAVGREYGGGWGQVSIGGAEGPDGGGSPPHPPPCWETLQSETLQQLKVG